jgi:hypothetical protein
MLTHAVATWIRRLGAFSAVLTGGSQMVPTHALEGEVVEIYGDYRVPERPVAVLALDLRLLHPVSGAMTAVRWQRTERREAPMDRAGADELVAAWNTALAEICRSLAAEMFLRPPEQGQPQARRGGRASPPEDDGLPQPHLVARAVRSVSAD